MVTESEILVLKSQQISLVVVKLNQHSQYSSAHEAMPLLTCNFHCSTCEHVMWHFRKKLAQLNNEIQLKNNLFRLKLNLSGQRRNGVSASTEAFFGTVCLIAVRRSDLTLI